MTPEKLAACKAKRDFSITSEPAEGGAAGIGALSFVVQKHWPTRLHDDFRIELDGVMMSWTVPKAPSHDPLDNRLAAHVEDHPISYSSSEFSVGGKFPGSVKQLPEPERAAKAAARKAAAKQAAPEMAAALEAVATPSSRPKAASARAAKGTALPPRSSDRIKLKCSHRQEFVIGGWTDPKALRTCVGSLLLGVYEGGKLRYAGNVGAGFDTKALSATRAKLDEAKADTSPFANGDAIPGRPHWVESKLVAEVTFGWTSAGHIRHSLFHALRFDKYPKAIVRAKAPGAPRGSKAHSPANAAPKAARAPHEELVSHALNTKLRITDSEHVIDVSTGITKVELIRRHALVGKLMMAHLRGRPVSLVRAGRRRRASLVPEARRGREATGDRPAGRGARPRPSPMLEVAAPRRAAVGGAVEHGRSPHANATAKDYEHSERIVFDLDPGADLDSSKAFSKAVVDHVSVTIPQMFVNKAGGVGNDAWKGYAKTLDAAAATLGFAL